MLQLIRTKASGWIAGIIVGALIISFALWGLGSYENNSSEVNVATVNDVDIDARLFQRNVSHVRRHIQSLSNTSFSPEDEQLIKDETLKKLINMELVNQLVADENLQVSDAKVIATIQDVDFFNSEDGFDRQKYERSIADLSASPALFEAQLKQDLLSTQLQAGLAESSFVTNSELAKMVQLSQQTRDINYSILPLANFIDESAVTETEVEAFYQANSSRYQAPEKIKIAYLELALENLAAAIATPDEATLMAYYGDNKDKYITEEQRSLQKLFIKTAIESEANDEEVMMSEVLKEKANTTMQAALSMAKEGQSFEDIIEHFADQDNRLLQFSEHQLVKKAVMAKEIDAFLFQSEQGDLSDIIETKDTLNIVKVGEIKGGDNTNYESVAEAVLNDYKNAQAELQFFELADTLARLTYEHPNSLQPAADATGLTITETDYFSREDEAELISHPKVKAASFDTDLISNRENSNIIELTDTHIVVLNVTAYKAAETKPLTAVYDNVVTDVATDKAIERLTTEAETIVSQLKDGVEIAMIDTDIELEWQQFDGVKRDDPTINRAVLRSAFRTGKATLANPVIASSRLGSGDYAIVMVTGVHAGEVTDDQEIMQTIKQQLKQNYRNRDWQDLLDNVKESATVRIYENNI